LVRCIKIGFFFFFFSRRGVTEACWQSETVPVSDHTTQTNVNKKQEIRPYDFDDLLKKSVTERVISYGKEVGFRYSTISQQVCREIGLNMLQIDEHHFREYIQ